MHPICADVSVNKRVPHGGMNCLLVVNDLRKQSFRTKTCYDDFVVNVLGNISRSTANLKKYNDNVKK